MWIFFRNILRLLIDNIKEEDSSIKVTVLQTLRAIFEKPELSEFCCHFVQLLTLKVLDAHTDDRREVSIICKKFNRNRSNIIS